MTEKTYRKSRIKISLRHIPLASPPLNVLCSPHCSQCFLWSRKIWKLNILFLSTLLFFSFHWWESEVPQTHTVLSHWQFTVVGFSLKVAAFLVPAPVETREVAVRTRHKGRVAHRNVSLCHGCGLTLTATTLVCGCFALPVPPAGDRDWVSHECLSAVITGGCRCPTVLPQLQP